jgi:hypothetical protein
VLLLYGVSAVAGGAALLLGQIKSSTLIFGAIGVEILALAWFGAYLSRYRQEGSAVVRPLARNGETENGHRTLVDSVSRQDAP